MAAHIFQSSKYVESSTGHEILRHFEDIEKELIQSTFGKTIIE